MIGGMPPSSSFASGVLAPNNAAASSANSTPGCIFLEPDGADEDRSVIPEIGRNRDARIFRRAALVPEPSPAGGEHPAVTFCEQYVRRSCLQKKKVEAWPVHN